MFDELWSDLRYRVRSLLRRDNVERVDIWAKC